MERSEIREQTSRITLRFMRATTSLGEKDKAPPSLIF
jgi:hypothetical protein